MYLYPWSADSGGIDFRALLKWKIVEWTFREARSLEDETYLNRLSFRPELPEHILTLYDGSSSQQNSFQEMLKSCMATAFCTFVDASEETGKMSVGYRRTMLTGFFLSRKRPASLLVKELRRKSSPVMHWFCSLTQRTDGPVIPVIYKPCCYVL